ncbi:hypothetical protein DFJ77DRAFT_442238 [Powellomyces hirtus]|nr:hypothetical protein DFJ77DRAFT_442238 [Powellomyces hirtus]
MTTELCMSNCQQTAGCFYANWNSKECWMKQASAVEPEFGVGLYNEKGNITGGSSDKPNTVATVAGTIAGVAGVAVGVAVLFFCNRKKRKRGKTINESQLIDSAAPCSHPNRRSSQRQTRAHTTSNRNLTHHPLSPTPIPDHQQPASPTDNLPPAYDITTAASSTEPDNSEFHATRDNLSVTLDDLSCKEEDTVLVQHLEVASLSM